MTISTLESFIFTEAPIAFIEDDVLLPPALEKWLLKSFVIRKVIHGNLILLDQRYDVFVLSGKDSEKWDIVRCESLSSGGFILMLQPTKNDDNFFDVDKVVFDSNVSISVFIPKIWVVNKVASYAYKDGSHLEWPFPALVPRKENKELVECADITNSGVKRARAVNQFYEALKSQYTNVPFDFSFCAIGMPFPVDQELFSMVSQVFHTGLIVDSLSDSDFKIWNEDWLPKYMADGSTTREITRANSSSIKKFFEDKRSPFSRIKNNYVITSIVLGKYIPSFGGCCAVAGFFLCPINGVTASNWFYLIKHFESCLNAFVLKDSRLRFQLSATKSAIGSIMSRNGSHNIGSHVLAALSHNVGTMPDDRVLYQYIQHRMDYIATATTDFPTWYQPTMFVGEIMRNFFIQKHLLDHIAESEGLHAFYFQGNEQKTSDNGAICISVRRLMADAFDSNACVLRPEHKTKQNFVIYDNDHPAKLEQIVFDDDVQLAIPAGVVGNHAIYTIIENVLRNAAKHGKSGKDSNLEIAIGFINDEDKEYAEFFIWNKSLKESGIDVENLVNDIRVRMQEPFIDKDGQLRREDWGLAEMKISAGILQRRSISEIGGLEHVGMDHVKDSEWGDREIISPIRVEGENGAFHFGYSFFVPKPKEFLFVFSEAVKIPGWIIRLLRKNGIYLADGFSRDGNGVTSYNLIEISDNDNSQTTHKVETAYNFSFVVLPQDAIDDVFIKSDSFPFRLMVWKVGEASKQKNGQSKLIWRRDDDTQSLIPEFVEQCEAITALTALQTDCSGGVSIAIAAIKDRVYKKWLEYLESKTRDAGLRKVRRELKVLVNVDGNDHTRGSGRSLISDVDIWKFVFKNLFRTTLRTFCSQHAELAERIAPTIYALSMMNVDVESASIDPRDDDKQTYNIKKVKELLSRPISASIKEQVRKSLSSMWLYLGFLNVLDADQEELSYVLSKLKMIDNTSEEVQFIEHTSVLDDVKDRFKDLANKYSVARIKEDLPFSDGFDTLKKYFKDHFKCQGPKMEVPSLNASASVDMSNAQTLDILLKFLLAAYHAADVMLRKYSEQIATLPLIYTAADGNVGEAGADVEQFKERIGVDACLDATRTNLPILYYRHGTNAACSIYNEGLSGSQSCMMQMQAFVRKPNAEFLFQLTESALMRVLIVDERFSRFLCKRKENAKKLSWMNIWSVNTDVLLDPKVTALQMDVDVSHKTEAPLKISMDLLEKGEIPHGKFDILIVHQGIIDKMLGNASPDEVNTVLENLKQSVPYVVVTTGRGIPANIPPVARVLPFSSIERYLFQEYPEKLLLVNAVMSLLPCGRR